MTTTSFYSGSHDCSAFSAFSSRTSAWGRAHYSVDRGAPLATIDAEFSGQVKWFKDAIGYGFITVMQGPPDKDVWNVIGRDIFVHHTDVLPKVSTYKTLVKGEYVSFNLNKGAKDIQAVNVKGIFGGTLLCDSINVRYLNRVEATREPVVLQNGDIVYQPGDDAVL